MDRGCGATISEPKRRLKRSLNTGDDEVVIVLAPAVGTTTSKGVAAEVTIGGPVKVLNILAAERVMGTGVCITFEAIMVVSRAVVKVLGGGRLVSNVAEKVRLVVERRVVLEVEVVVKVVREVDWEAGVGVGMMEEGPVVEDSIGGKLVTVELIVGDELRTISEAAVVGAAAIVDDAGVADGVTIEMLGSGEQVVSWLPASCSGTPLASR